MCVCIIETDTVTMMTDSEHDQTCASSITAWQIPGLAVIHGQNQEMDELIP